MTITPVAGLRFERYCKDITPDGFLRQKIERFFWRDFSGEIFLEQHYCPYNFVSIN